MDFWQQEFGSNSLLRNFQFPGCFVEKLNAFSGAKLSQAK